MNGPRAACSGRSTNWAAETTRGVFRYIRL
jgi:hypothetical protein